MAASRRALKPGHWLWERHHGRCAWCSITLVPSDSRSQRTDNTASRDHLNPRVRGQRQGPHDVVLACLWCNSHRSNLPASVWETSSTLQARQARVRRQGLT